VSAPPKPAVDRCFDEGRVAYLAGDAREDACPYEPDTEAAGKWLDGWDWESSIHSGPEDGHG
jgi:ribosome modulation factor